MSLPKNGFDFAEIPTLQIVDTDEDALKYQTCFYDNFEWSVLENALKWRKMEEERVTGNVK